MSFFFHKLTTSIVSVLVVLVLLVGCGMACAQPLMAKSTHSCCDPKGSCKSKSAQMQSNGCERDPAPVPHAISIAVDLSAAELSPVTVASDAFPAVAQPVSAIPVQHLTPLRI